MCNNAQVVSHILCVDENEADIYVCCNNVCT